MIFKNVLKAVSLALAGLFFLPSGAFADDTQIQGQLLSTCVVKSKKMSFHWSLERAQIGIQWAEDMSWFDIEKAKTQLTATGFTSYVFQDFYGEELHISTDKIEKAEYLVGGEKLLCENKATLNVKALDDAALFSQTWVQPEDAKLAFQCAVSASTGEDTLIQLFSDVAGPGTVTLVRGETGFVNRKVLGAGVPPQMPGDTSRLYKFNFGGGLNLHLVLPISDDTAQPLGSIVLDGKSLSCVSNQSWDYPALDKIVNSVQ